MVKIIDFNDFNNKNKQLIEEIKRENSMFERYYSILSLSSDASKLEAIEYLDDFNLIQKVLDKIKNKDLIVTNINAIKDDLKKIFIAINIKDKRKRLMVLSTLKERLSCEKSYHSLDYLKYEFVTRFNNNIDFFKNIRILNQIINSVYNEKILKELIIFYDKKRINSLKESNYYNLLKIDNFGGTEGILYYIETVLKINSPELQDFKNIAIASQIMFLTNPKDLLRIINAIDEPWVKCIIASLLDDKHIKEEASKFTDISSNTPFNIRQELNIKALILMPRQEKQSSISYSLDYYKCETEAEKIEEIKRALFNKVLNQKYKKEYFDNLLSKYEKIILKSEDFDFLFRIQDQKYLNDFLKKYLNHLNGKIPEELYYNLIEASDLSKVLYVLDIFIENDIIYYGNTDFIFRLIKICTNHIEDEIRKTSIRKKIGKKIIIQQEEKTKKLIKNKNM